MICEVWPDKLPIRTHLEFIYRMKQFVLILLVVASTGAIAQTSPQAASAPHHPAVNGSASVTKLPPGVPPVRGVVKTAFSLRYRGIKIGTGAEAEPNMLYKVHYTGWVAADGRKFDSSYDHPGSPVPGKDGKPILGEDGKPVLGNPQPIAFPQGFGRVIPGFDQGFTGMKIGGKRRLFIPWQLAYGARGRPGQDAAHPGIPPKADLIFDVELVEVSDIPMPANRPAMGAMPGGRPMQPGSVPPGHVPVTPAPQAPAATPANPTDSNKPSTPPQPQSH